jgi:vacuolar-type H+-ATPase subunit F/Vma7
MARVLYLGDEATAAGFRLAGADVRVPPPEEAAELLRRAIDSDHDLVLVSAGLLPSLPAGELEAAVVGGRPLIVVVPDVHGRHAAPDVARDVRYALGIES